MSVWGRFVAAVGLDDGDGHLSFNKLVTLVMCFLFGVMVVARLSPPWPVLSFGVVIIGAGFGLKGYMAAIANRRETFNATLAASTDVKLTGDLAKVIEAVKARRDETLGVEAT